VKVDLTNVEETRKCIRNEKPSVIVHAAAQRFPNKVDADYAAAERLNVEVSRVLAEEASTCDSRSSSPVSSMSCSVATYRRLTVDLSLTGPNFFHLPEFTRIYSRWAKSTLVQHFLAYSYRNLLFSDNWSMNPTQKFGHFKSCGCSNTEF
jgi:hypothetical protein